LYGHEVEYERRNSSLVSPACSMIESKVLFLLDPVEEPLLCVFQLHR
jgi:hypothetical protein